MNPNYIRVSAKVSDPFTKVHSMRSVAFKSADGTSGPYGSVGPVGLMSDAQKTSLVSLLNGKSFDGAFKQMFVQETNARETEVGVATNVVAYHHEVYTDRTGDNRSAVESSSQKYYVYIVLENETGYQLIQPSAVTVVGSPP